MPRTNRPPAYRLHKARNCAVVTIDGKNHYLGPYGSPESHEKYARLIAEWRRQLPATCSRRPAAVGGRPDAVDQRADPRLLPARPDLLRQGRPAHQRAGQHPPGPAVRPPALRHHPGRRLRPHGPQERPPGHDRRRALPQADQQGRQPDPADVRLGRRERAAARRTSHQALRRVKGLRKGPLGGQGDRAGRAGARGGDRGRSCPTSRPRSPPWSSSSTSAAPGRRRSSRSGPARSTPSGDVWLYQPRSHKTEHLDREQGHRARPEGPGAPAALARPRPRVVLLRAGGGVGLAPPAAAAAEWPRRSTGRQRPDVGVPKRAPGLTIHPAQLPRGDPAGLPAGGHPGLVAAAVAAHAGHDDPPGVRAGGGQGRAGPRRHEDHRDLRRARPRAGDRGS